MLGTALVAGDNTTVKHTLTSFPRLHVSVKRVKQCDVKNKEESIGHEVQWVVITSVLEVDGIIKTSLRLRTVSVFREMCSGEELVSKG